MDYIQGKPRAQIVLFESSLEERIDLENPVRVIDVFVDTCNLAELGFSHSKHSPEGRPPYHPGDLLKLFVYGYLNRVRSSRLLERECGRNLELMWLLKELTPDHNTIANFRRDNPRAIKAVFRKMVMMCKRLDLVGGKVIATDGTKLRAQNSKKNNYNQKKIDDHLAYIENKLREYLDALELADAAEAMGLDPEVDREKVKEKIDKCNEKKRQYEEMERQLAETGQEQISTTDPDSRKMVVRQTVVEVCYNVQTSVDDKHYLPIDFKTTSNNDAHALANMAVRAKAILGNDEFVELADKGYHTGEEIRKCHEAGVETMVAIPKTPVSSQAPDPAYNQPEFRYDKENDCYFCPQGQKLTSSGTWYQHHPYRTKQYLSKACGACPVKARCTRSPKGRIIERNENVDAMARNKRAIEGNKELYKRRQEIVEHPFGTIKRQWGFDHTLMRGRKKVDGEVGLIFIAYLFTRLRSILGLEGLKKAFQDLFDRFWHPGASPSATLHFFQFIELYFRKTYYLLKHSRFFVNFTLATETGGSF